MQSTVPSTMSQGPASLCKQAQRAGKPLNLSSPIVCTLVDGGTRRSASGGPLRLAAVEALRLRRNGEGCGPQRTGGVHQTWPDVEAALSCMFEDERGKDGPSGGAEGTAMQRLFESSPVGRSVHGCIKLCCNAKEKAR